MNLRTRFFAVITILLLANLCAAQNSQAVEISFDPQPADVREEAFNALSNRLVLANEQGQQQKRFIKRINFGASWIPENGDDGLGIADAKASFTFALPGPKWEALGSSYFLISPSFKYSNVQWNRSTPFPDSLYNTGLNITWMQPINERWSTMLNATPSYSGDGKADDYFFRCPLIIGANWTPNAKWKVLFGVAYLDRGDIPVIPFGGFTYAPNDDWKFECMAPQPRIARRLAGWSDSQVDRWCYLGGGFGGDTWAISSVGDRSDIAMYREYSVLLGYESIRKPGTFQWNAEIAYLFGRKVEFEYETQSDYKPNDSLALRVRVSF